MFADNDLDPEKLDLMDAPFAAWLEPKLRDGSYFGFMAEEQGTVVAGIGLVLLDFPPHPLHPASDKRGYILNVYVDPAYRGRGLAQRMMACADDEFRKRGVVYAVLHASKMGRPVYEGLNWETTTEMGKVLA